MTWKLNDKIIKEGQAWSDDNGVQHPANWSIWSDAEKKSAGLTFVTPVDNSFDNRFYYSKGVERSLTDILVTDEKGDKVIDPLTGKQMIQVGLKNQYIAQTKQTANNLLSTSDWMVIRNAEKTTAIPSDITTYRDSVRTSCTTIETAINNASDMKAFISLFDTPLKDGVPTGNAPINDWPTE